MVPLCPYPSTVLLTLNDSVQNQSHSPISWNLYIGCWRLLVQDLHPCNFCLARFYVFCTVHNLFPYLWLAFFFRPYYICQMESWIMQSFVNGFFYLAQCFSRFFHVIAWMILYIVWSILYMILLYSINTSSLFIAEWGNGMLDKDTVELLAYMVTPCLTFWGNSKLISKVTSPYSNPTSNVWVT